MKIFYHNDLDGQCSAHLVNRLDDYPMPSNCFYAMQYGMEFPLDEIEADEDIYILDYSVEPDEMKRLLEITTNIIWIDHHKTAIAKLEVFSDLSGLREVGRAGCVLTWDWCLCNKYRGTNETFQDIPRYVQLIGDFDVWNFEFGDETRLFRAGCDAEDTHPRSPIWHWFASSPEAVIEQGKIVQKFMKKNREEYLRNFGYYTKWRDYLCFVCNTPAWGSMPFEAVASDAEIWVSFRYEKLGYWTVSLYSTKVDVSEIAKQFEFNGKRGGGHKGAAGFQTDYLEFLVRGEGEAKG